MDNRCENLALGPTLNIDGLNQCNLIISCECRYEDGAICDSADNGNYIGSAGAEHSFYRIQSEASCGTGFARGYNRFELNEKSP